MPTKCVTGSPSNSVETHKNGSTKILHGVEATLFDFNSTPRVLPATRNGCFVIREGQKGTVLLTSSAGTGPAFGSIIDDLTGKEPFKVVDLKPLRNPQWFRKCGADEINPNQSLRLLYTSGSPALRRDIHSSTDEGATWIPTAEWVSPLGCVLPNRQGMALKSIATGAVTFAGGDAVRGGSLTLDPAIDSEVALHCALVPREDVREGLRSRKLRLVRARDRQKKTIDLTPNAEKRWCRQTYCENSQWAQMLPLEVAKRFDEPVVASKCVLISSRFNGAISIDQEDLSTFVWKVPPAAGNGHPRIVERSTFEKIESSRALKTHVVVSLPQCNKKVPFNGIHLRRNQDFLLGITGAESQFTVRIFFDSQKVPSMTSTIGTDIGAGKIRLLRLELHESIWDFVKYRENNVPSSFRIRIEIVDAFGSTAEVGESLTEKCSLTLSENEVNGPRPQVRFIRESVPKNSLIGMSDFVDGRLPLGARVAIGGNESATLDYDSQDECLSAGGFSALQNDKLNALATGVFHYKIRLCSLSGKVLASGPINVHVDDSLPSFSLAAARNDQSSIDSSGGPARSFVKKAFAPIFIELHQIRDDSLSFNSMISSITCEVSLVGDGGKRFTLPSVCKVAESNPERAYARVKQAFPRPGVVRT